MTLLAVWFLAYVLPAFLTACWVKLLSRQQGGSPKNLIIVHLMLIFSIAVSQYFIHSRGLAFPMPGIWSVVAYIIATALATWMISWLGLWYSISALVQQLCLLSIAFLLLPGFPVWVVVLLIVPLFVFCHQLTGVPHWRVRILLISAWGAVSVTLFAFVPNLVLIAALHTLLGALLIRRSVLYGVWKR